jgi:gliding motility-associated-like protein
LSFTTFDSKDIFKDNLAILQIDEPAIGVYKWKVDGEKLPTGNKVEFRFKSEGTKMVEVEYTSNIGCVHSFEQAVEFKKDFIEAFPKHFTPFNYDGKNDNFELIVLKDIEFKNYRLKIYNSKEEVVFSTTNPNENWNGKLNNSGVNQPKGPYVWILELESNKGEKKRINNIIKIVD